MPVPDYQTLMLPMLTLLSDGAEHTVREARERIAEQYQLTEEDLRQTVPSGKKLLFADRLSWATTYLKQSGLVESTKRGVYRITRRGADVLATRPARIDTDLLAQFPEFLEFTGRTPTRAKPEARRKPVEPDVETPEEQLDSAYQQLRSTIEAELLQQVKAASPEFFERTVVELLVRMGYGGTLADAGRAIGRSGDGGIDGIIKEDRLGLDVIHVQAKRWDNKTVGRPEVQGFAGSLDGVRARKGIFITTSAFSADALAFVDRIDKRIILIDGERLVGLMFDFGLGVTQLATYDVKRVDSDYFSEE
jgi:restriction system protein